MDVSFISLAKVLPAVLGCMAAAYDMLALVKPQFEVGRGRVGKGGVVRVAGERRAALSAVGTAARAMGAARAGLLLLGAARPEGQPREFVWLAEPGRLGGAAGERRGECGDGGGAGGGAMRAA